MILSENRYPLFGIMRRPRTITVPDLGSTATGSGILPADKALSGPPARAYDRFNNSPSKEPAMNEEALNMSLRKFLKVVGVTSQQEIEKAIRAAVADGRLKGSKTVEAQMVLTIGKVGLNHKVDGTIELE
jgi:hypothetical protein